MTLEYELTKQDYIEFNIFHIKNSKTLKKSILIQQFSVAIIYLALPFLLAKVTYIPLSFWFPAFFIAAILWVIFYPKCIIAMSRKRISKLVDEGKNNDMLCRHILEINQEGIIDSSENGESKIGWSGVEEIKEAEQYYFIYISSVMAYIVPKRVFLTEESHKEFLNYINIKLLR